MNIEANLIISILKLTRNGPVTHKLIKNDAMVPLQIVEKLLRKMQNDGLLYFGKNVVEVNNVQRLKLATQAIKLGADVENISSLLQWQEFENIAAIAFEQNSYSIAKNFRFKHAPRRWEIDIVGCKKPLVVCVDCKHLRHGIYPSALKKIVTEQVERTSALAETMPSLAGKLECASWDYAKLIPAVLSLVTGRFKFCENVPIVPVLQLQDFLSQLPAYADELKHFTKNLV
ncbi:hypothetical protein HXY33_05260 [Candidatus Bathyarchaeota archaeon]|nr:hypothetical protein [Candidatus Bathyarchaeota archaeon]